MTAGVRRSLQQASTVGGNSARSDVEPTDADHFPDFNKLDQYTLQGTDAGDALMSQALSLYKDISNR